jgi:hypothetical protein
LGNNCAFVSHCAEVKKIQNKKYILIFQGIDLSVQIKNAAGCSETSATGYKAHGVTDSTVIIVFIYSHMAACILRGISSW